MAISRRDYVFYVKGYINVTEDVPDGWTVKAVMQKCQDMRNLDTCDFFKAFRIITSACSEQNSGEELYDDFFNHTRPRMSCPLKAGNYYLLNYPFYMKKNYFTVFESKISMSIFGYTLLLEGFNQDQKILCANVALQLQYSRDSKPLLILHEGDGVEESPNPTSHISTGDLLSHSERPDEEYEDYD